MRIFLVTLVLLGLVGCAGTGQTSQNSSQTPTIVPTPASEYHDFLTKHHPIELQTICSQTSSGLFRVRTTARPYPEIQDRLFSMSIDDRQRFCSEVAELKSDYNDILMLGRTTPTPEHEVGRYKYDQFERAVVARIPVGYSHTESIVEACMVSKDGTRPIKEFRSGLFEEGTIRWVVDGFYLLSPNGRFKYCYDAYNYMKDPQTLDTQSYATPTATYADQVPSTVEKLEDRPFGYSSSRESSGTEPQPDQGSRRVQETETWEEFERRLRGLGNPEGQ